MTVTLLQNYLSAVRVFLPRRVDQQDILSELSAHLQIKFEEREEELGRALTEDEQAAVLSDYGNPLVVAGRYGAANLGLAFGRQLIGPEVFQLYRRILIAQFTLTLLVVTAIQLLGGTTRDGLGRYLVPMLIQFTSTTVIFIGVDAFKRRSRSRDAWNFPPPYMQAVPRWQSVSGFVTLSVFALWWALIPYAPYLLLGRFAEGVAFTTGWHAFYWPVLTLFIVGAIQRLVTFVEPTWSGLQAVTRLATNGLSVALLYAFVKSAPYVVAIGGAGTERIAERINSAVWWNSWTTFGLYWLINAAFMAWLCQKHATRWLRKRREQLVLQQGFRQS